MPSLKFFSFPFDALRPRQAPTFWPAESRQRLAKEGCAPFGIPPGGRARVPSAQPREGSDGTPSRLRGRSFREICEGIAAKAVSDAVPCAGAHDRQTFPNGERGGQMRMTGKRSPTGNLGGPGGEAPIPKRWRCGGRGERAGARGLPQRHRSSSREAARSSANPDSAARLGGFQRGASSTPLWSGDSQGGETPLRLSLPTFCRGRK